jgi:hypothetical protein
MCVCGDIPPIFHYNRAMAVQVDDLVAACNVLADAQTDRITDRSAILAKIRSAASTMHAAELFQRAVALNSTLGADGVARLLGIGDGDTIPDIVFNVASCVPLQRPSESERGHRPPYEFDRETFVAALRAKLH